MEQVDGIFLKRHFDYYFEAPLTVWDTVAPYIITRQFKKNEIIKEAGKTENFIDIIFKGSIGVFLWTDNHTKCLDLFYEEYFSGDYMSYIENRPSELFTQALEHTEVFSMSRQNIEALYSDKLIGEKIVGAAARSLFVHKQKQQIDLLTKTAEERYQLMMKETPELLHRTASKHIASYLGVTPESLSRIRAKHS